MGRAAGGCTDCTGSALDGDADQASDRIVAVVAATLADRGAGKACLQPLRRRLLLIGLDAQQIGDARRVEGGAARPRAAAVSSVSKTGWSNGTADGIGDLVPFGVPVAHQMEAGQAAAKGGGIAEGEDEDGVASAMLWKMTSLVSKYGRVKSTYSVNMRRSR